MTMWLVTEGEYSDYRVVCVCPTEEAAKQIIAAMSGDQYDNPNDEPEEIEVRSEPPNRAVVLYFHAKVGISGEVADQQERVRVESWWDDQPKPKLKDCRVVPPVYYKTIYQLDGIAGVAITVEGTDQERVRKRWSEVLAQTRADAALICERLDQTVEAASG